MHTIQLNQVCVDYPGRRVFDGLTWAIGDRDRVGLVGANGVGKSSLLRVLAGLYKPDEGVITRARGVEVGYLPQSVSFEGDISLIDAAMTMPLPLARVDAALNAVEARLSDPNVYNDEKKLAAALGEQETLLIQYERLGGTRHAGRVRELLSHFGFTPDQFDIPARLLSGGQKKLIALTCLAVAQPDVLLLDEPDNHLDLDAKRRLESFLRDYFGAVVIVSHDRYLLDEVANQIAELENGKLTIYHGNYTTYMMERELNRLRQQQMYAAQQKRIEQIEAAIKRWEIAAKVDEDERAARQAKSRRKMLDRMEANGEIIDRPYERRALELEFGGDRGSTKALEVQRLAMAFDDNFVFEDVDFLVRHGERVGLVGANGAGKSVLFKLVMGDMEPFDGVVKIGQSTRVGYYAQEHQTLEAFLDKTAIDFIRDVAPVKEDEAVAFLIKLLFTYEQTRMPIHTLSGGERSRLQLAALMLTRPNLLLLDEPTNNLDIPAAEALESALEEYEGAVFVISHDRYFLDRVVDRVIELREGCAHEFIGGYTDYLALRDRKMRA